MHSFVGKIFCFKCNFATMDFQKLVNKSISLFSSSILRSPNFESHILLAKYKKQLEELNNPSRPWTKSQKHISITYFSLPCLIINSSTPQLSFNIHLFHSLIYTLHIHITDYLDNIVQKDVVLMLNGKYNISILFDAGSVIFCS